MCIDSKSRTTFNLVRNVTHMTGLTLEVKLLINVRQFENEFKWMRWGWIEKKPISLYREKAN